MSHLLKAFASSVYFGMSFDGLQKCAAATAGAPYNSCTPAAGAYCVVSVHHLSPIFQDGINQQVYLNPIIKINKKKNLPLSETL